MTTPSRHSEADAIEDVYQWALGYVAASAVQATLEEWDNGSAAASPRQYDRMVTNVTRMVMLRRSWLVELALAYYRLVSALRTGSTIQAPGVKNTNVTIDTLRDEFDAVVDEIEKHGGAIPKRPTEPRDPRDVAPRPADPKISRPTEKVKVEELPEVDFEEIVQEANDRALEQIETGIREQMKEAIDASLEKDLEPEERRDDTDSKGRQIAAKAARISLLAARDQLYDISFADKNAIGWIRYSWTGTPCGFCAMLLSRGFTEKSGLYSSRQTAKGENGEEYHENCMCRAVPVFSVQQLESDLFSLNRQYAEEWPRVTEGLHGKDALNAWRTHIRKSNQASLADAA